MCFDSSSEEGHRHRVQWSALLQARYSQHPALGSNVSCALRGEVNRDIKNEPKKKKKKNRQETGSTPTVNICIVRRKNVPLKQKEQSPGVHFLLSSERTSCCNNWSQAMCTSVKTEWKTRFIVWYSQGKALTIVQSLAPNNSSQLKCQLFLCQQWCSRNRIKTTV